MIPVLELFRVEYIENMDDYTLNWVYFNTRINMCKRDGHLEELCI